MSVGDPRPRNDADRVDLSSLVNLSGPTFTDTLRMCLLGGSKSSQVDSEDQLSQIQGWDTFMISKQANHHTSTPFQLDN